MSKIFDKLITILNDVLIGDSEDEYGDCYLVGTKVIKDTIKALELGKLYKEYYDYLYIKELENENK